uniref:Uncharacterized protein n=1 Tax=Arundo donax TaxID=35708 RepID=A0A0A9GLR2_ARUDO
MNSIQLQNVEPRAIGAIFASIILAEFLNQILSNLDFHTKLGIQYQHCKQDSLINEH